MMFIYLAYKSIPGIHIENNINKLFLLQEIESVQNCIKFFLFSFFISVEESVGPNEKS